MTVAAVAAAMTAVAAAAAAEGGAAEGVPAASGVCTPTGNGGVGRNGNRIAAVVVSLCASLSWGLALAFGLALGQRKVSVKD